MKESSSTIDVNELKDRTARILQASEVTHKESIALIAAAKALLAEMAKEDDLVESSVNVGKD